MRRSTYTPASKALYPAIRALRAKKLPEPTAEELVLESRKLAQAGLESAEESRTGNVPHRSSGFPTVVNENEFLSLQMYEVSNSSPNDTLN